MTREDKRINVATIMCLNEKILKENSLVLCTGMIKLVSKHRAQLIYTRNTKGGDEETPAEKA